METYYQTKSFHSQLADCVKQAKQYFFLRLSGQPGKKILVRQDQNNIVPLNDGIEFLRYLKDMIAKYLNYGTFSLFKDPALNGIDVEGIYIRRKDIENAEKQDFSLKRELKLLQEELNLDPDFVQDEEIPGQGELPFTNGVMSFGRRYFADSLGLILQYLNADYSTAFASENLPFKFQDLVRTGVTRSDLLEKDNNDRVNAMLDCLSYLFFPGNSLRKIFFIVDKSHSFQNTICEIMKKILGGYATSLTPEKIAKKNRRNLEPLFNTKLIQGFLWVDVVIRSDENIHDVRMIKAITDDPLTETIKTAYGKVLVLSDSMPQFECNDEDIALLNDRVVIIEWQDTPIDAASPLSLVEELTTAEMQSRIASWLASKAFHFYTNGRFNLRIPASFQLQRTMRIFDRYKILDAFLKEVLAIYNGGTFDLESPHPVCASDLFNVYTQWFTNRCCNLIDKSVSEKPFSMYLSKYLSKFPLVEKKRYPNGSFYSGVMIRHEYVNFPLRIPQNGNWHTPTGYRAQKHS
jgi:hypothetical protein